uniref:Cytochrome f n=1 Tax=Gronococcus sybilensis TaxID=3028029 RepID=A0A9Y1I2L4_9RHOD|nr:cytochrome f [Gronococcus sybilensis]
MKKIIQNYSQSAFNRQAVIVLILLINILSCCNHSYAYPIYAQQAYENPREATGRIVCANCHLVQKKVSIDAPKSVLPNTVFEARVNLPYNINDKQILGNGSKGPLNVGAVLVLPEGFKLAPKNKIPDSIKQKTKGLYFSQYSKKYENILVIGPVPGNKNQEIIFPILSPDPKTSKNINFLKYPIYVGGNRGRGQLYPTGDKSNNNVITSPIKGQVSQIVNLEKGGYQVTVKNDKDDPITQTVPLGISLTVQEGQKVNIDDNLTTDPNAGGFGQAEGEIVLQSPRRVIFFIGFSTTMLVAQVSFVLKKKQFEKVQAAEMNF